jgi:hypothetical protein
MTDYLGALRTRLTDEANRQTRFGPYLILSSVPWLFLASALRLFFRRSDGLGSIYVFLILEQTVLLIAFLLAAARMIHLMGGRVVLAELSFGEQRSLTARLAWKLTLVYFVSVCAALILGTDKNTAVRLWFGLDGIVYVWFRPGMVYFWNAALAIVVYLVLVNKGLGKPPKLYLAVAEFFKRIQFFGPALAALAAFYSVCYFIQMNILSDALDAIYATLPDDTLKNLFNVGSYTVISYARLWVTVAVLSYTLRQSYHAGQ